MLRVCTILYRSLEYELVHNMLPSRVQPCSLFIRCSFRLQGSKIQRRSRRFARQAENSEEEFRMHKIPAPDRGGWIDCRRRCCQPPPCQEWLPSLLRFCGWGCSSPPSRPSSSDRGAALRRPRPPPPSQCTLSSSPRRR